MTMSALLMYLVNFHVKYVKLPCCMKLVRKSKKLELCYIMLKMHAHCRFADGFFTSNSTTKCGWF